MNANTDISIRGEQGGQCRYEGCETDATVLVRFEKTKPVVHSWLCPAHSGAEVSKHDDAETVDPSEIVRESDGGRDD